MKPLQTLYRHSLATLTDLYQLTMAYGYWKLGRHERGAAFNLFFRKHPFDGGYTVAAGLEYALDFLDNVRFTDDDLSYLASVEGNDGKPIFDEAFLDVLRELKFEVDVLAVAEGTVVFPHQPLLRVTGPIMQCQLLETPLLNLVNFQTLIATKASRVCAAAKGDAVIEFGLRRAQGVDGGIAASRAAVIGGCAGTSNVLAGKLFGTPIKGTHAHSWVMSFDTEMDAFEGYAEALPNNCVFLVDTYDTLEGVKRAAAVGKKLRQRGHEMVGIRLDSGDLAYLSIEARRILDDAGFEDAGILASSDLDEHLITSLKEQGAKINVWGVGTKLATAYDQPALGGVYKLAAVQDENGEWQDKVKLSEQTIKTNIPGLVNVRRYSNNERFVADLIYDERLGVADPPTVVHPADALRRRTMEPELQHDDLLIEVVKNGEVIYDSPSVNDMQQRAKDQLAKLHPTIRRLVNPHEYPAGLEQQLHEKRTRLIVEAREEK